MSWHGWADELRQAPQQAVADLLRGAADISPFERATPHEFLLAILPSDSRILSRALLGEPRSTAAARDSNTDLPGYLDTGLSAWLMTQREAAKPAARKLGAYADQVCEALQWPLYFELPKTRKALQADRVRWLKWLGSLTLSAYRDPEYDYWQVLASHQTDDQLQIFWHAFVMEAGRTRSARYLNLGLLALARLPLSEEDSLRNLRLQVQALINRYQHRKGWGAPAQEDLAQALLGVMTRNPSLNAAHYRAFLTTLLAPLGEDTSISVLRLLGFSNAALTQRNAATISSAVYRLEPPGQKPETDQAVEDVRRSRSLEQAWNAIRPLLSAHEDFVHKSGDAYDFVRTLDRCARALCNQYTIPDPQIQGRLFQWIHLALQMDADDPRRWMLWELVLRQAGYPQRAQWVLWEMIRRFPDHLPCRVELARLLAASSDPLEQAQAQRLLQQVLQLDPENLHAYSTLAQLAIRRGDWPQALNHAQRGLQIDPADAACAVLLATAYARRGDVGALETAIDHLQRFTGRYPDQLRAESYLRQLLRRRQLVSQEQPIEYEDSEAPANSGPVLPERDPAWLAFAESIRTWTAAEDSPPPTEDPSSIDRVLPLPQALRRAVAQGQWETDILDRYEPAVQQEFPLETRLWRYLQTLHSSAASDGERDRAKRALGAWIEAEIRASTDESRSWVPYLSRFWENLNAPMNAALAVGTDWLKGLLDRYQPLPAPLFV